MRISTTLEILRRAEAGDSPGDIAAGMHLRAQVVRRVLADAGWPDRAAVATWKTTWLAEQARDVWAVAETVEQCAGAIRLNPDWVHRYTDELDREQLRLMVAVAVAMLPNGVDADDALRWTGARRPDIDDGPRRQTNPRVPVKSVPQILALHRAGKPVEDIARVTKLRPDSVQRVIDEHGQREEDVA